MTIHSKTNESARVKKLIAGASQHLSAVPNVTLNNVLYTLAAVLALLQSYVDLFDSVPAAKATYVDKLKTQRTLAPPLRLIVAAFVAYVRAAFGSSPEVLNDFGLKPHKAKTLLTAEQKVIAAEKAKATRAARHTMGVRQKAAIHGQVPGAAAGGAPAPAPAGGSPAPTPLNGPQAPQPGH
jgi:hypothetical protein